MKTKETIIPLTFENKEFVFLQFSDNYADEFNVEGFSVMSTEDWETFKSNIKDGFLSYGFGTNEGIEYESKEDFLRNIKVKSITVESAKMLFDLFGKVDFKHIGWDGKKFTECIKSTVVEYGKFPSNLGNLGDD